MWNSKSKKRNIGRRNIVVVLSIFLLTTSITTVIGTSFSQSDTSIELPAVSKDSMPTTNLFQQKRYVPQESNPVKVTIENDGELIRISYQIQDFSHETVQIESKDYNVLRLGEESNMLMKGWPDLPTICRSIIIDNIAKMEARVTHTQFKVYNNMLVAPSKGNLPRTVNPDDIPYWFDKMYTENRFFPHEIVELDVPYILRDFRGQVVKINPFQYNPILKQLRFYTDITIEISPTGLDTINCLPSQELPNKIDSDFKQIYEHHFLNFPTNPRYNPVEEQGNMLIITYDSFWDAMVPFVQWKTMKGTPTEMINVSEIGDENAIKTYISQYYNNQGLTFLLLVGDAAQVPTPILAGSASDPSYSYIVGSDHYPDLFVGRFSAQTIPQVETQIERSIEYEKYPQTGADWYHEGTGIASNEGPGDDDEYDWAHMRNIRTDLLNYYYTQVDELYDGSHGGGDASGNPTDSMVSTAVNDGRSIINYCGHGSCYSWGTTGFDNSNVDALTNDNMLPFIMSVACNNGEFNNYDACFAEAWLRATNSGEPSGAIAFFGSSISQSWNPPMDAQDEMVDILVESYADNRKTTVGALISHGCMHMNDEYGSSGYGETDYWTLFGDPSLQVRTNTPSSVTVMHDPTIDAGSSIYEVEVVGVEGALCALSRNYNLLGYAYTDGTGHATITFAAPVTIGEDIDLVVTAYNTVPYITSLEVTAIRQPAEFEPMEGVLIRYPFGIPFDLIAEMSEDVEVVTIVANTAQQSTVISQYSSNGVNLDHCSFLIAPSDSYWTRDYGPWFIFDSITDEMEVVDFTYNRPRPNDNQIPAAYAADQGFPLNFLDLIHAGGNYMTDGQGIAVSTDLVWIENPGLTPEEIEDMMLSQLGIRTYHLVPDVNDEYIKHIDCWAKYLAPDTILIREVPPSHSQYDEIEAAVTYFESQLNCYDTPYTVVRVYTPNDEPYTNSFILNDKVLVPQTGSAWDDEAITAYQTAMLGYEVLGFTALPLDPWVSTDAIHCRVKGIPDRNMLYIEHKPLSDGFPTDFGFEVNAKIISYSGALLIPEPTGIWWQLTGGNWNFIQLDPAGGDYYRAYIPPQQSGETVYYYIHVEDNSGRTANHPFIGAAGAHQFTVTPVPDIWINPLLFTLMKPTNSVTIETLTIGNEDYAGEMLNFDVTWTDDSGYSWLSVSPQQGSLSPGESINVDVTIDTNGVPPGDYQESIIITSDDPDEPLFNIPIDLTVTFGDDVGASNINSPPQIIDEGFYTVNVTVENFGSNNQIDVPVICEIYAGGGLPYTEDFEYDNGGYTPGGTSLWQWGKPASGPIIPHSGKYCWGTNLMGDYPDYANAYLDSIPIMLPPGFPTELSFWHWYDTESYYDGGNVKISTDNGATWSILGSYLDPYNEDAASSGNSGIPGEPCFSGHGQGYWEEVMFDLSSYAGQEVIIRWHFGSDYSIYYDGWYIDDVTINASSSRDGDSVYNVTATISVDAYSPAYVEFTPSWNATPGTYAVIVATDLTGDQQPANDQIATIVTVLAETCAADFNGDGDVDLDDYANFAQCYAGAGRPPAPSCPGDMFEGGFCKADFDQDNDVDLNDYAKFAQCFGGAGNPPSPSCPASMFG